MHTDSSTNHKIALVTGASRGIGLAIAEELARAGYQLYLTCRQSGNILTEVSDRLSATCHVPCKAIVADMGRPEDVTRVFSQIDDLTLLVNNAGISYVGLLHEMSVDAWQEVMRVNLDSMFYCCRLAIPLMLRRHAGKIINISSVWGRVGASTEVAYSASKGGVNAFTKALAKELAPSGIQVNAIACGLINTEMNLRLSEAERRSLIEDIPADRMGNTAEVAEMVCSVLSMPSYATGQIFTIDGGWL